MANIWEKAISILAGNFNSDLSYLITTVRRTKIQDSRGGAKFDTFGDPDCDEYLLSKNKLWLISERDLSSNIGIT